MANTDFFTADPHYFHANIIRYCKRPFLRAGDVVTDEKGNEKWSNNFVKRLRAAEMTDFLVKKHNEVVMPEDTVWFLGDFCFGGADMVIQTLRRLNGQYKIIWGNHDEGMRHFKTVVELYSDLAPRVEFLGDMSEINIEGQRIVLNHYSMRVWNGSHKGTWQLYGHSHGTLPDDKTALSIDVGVDCHDYKPISFEQVQKIMAQKEYKPVDHHGKD